MAGFLLDTNHLSKAINRVSRVRERIIRTATTEPVRTCVSVLCELEAGIQQTADPPGYRRRLDLLLESVRLEPLDQEIAQRYGELYLRLRNAGRALSMTDILLAAVAVRDGSVIVTADQDFAALPEIRTENWIEEAERGAFEPNNGT